MTLSGLVEDLQDRWRPVQARLFPRQVLLELRDDQLRGQVLRQHTPEPVSLEVPLPPLTCRDGMPLEKEPLGDLIGDLLVRDHLLDAYVLTALPPAAAEWRVVDWPLEALPDEPLEALRLIDPDLGLRQPLADSYIDLQPLPGAGASMLLVAAPRRLVEAWIDVFHMAGTRLERLAPAQTCQWAALQRWLARGPSDGLVALLDPQAEACRLVVLQDGVPQFERSLPAAGPALLAELQRCLAFLRQRLAAPGPLALCSTVPLADGDTLAQALGVPVQLPELGPYGSLVLQGLAMAEVQP